MTAGTLGTRRVGRRRAAQLGVLTRAWRDPGGRAGFLLLAALVCFVVVAPLLSGYSANGISFTLPFAGVSTAHLLGTDELGRDTLTRLAVGGRTSLLLSLAATALAAGCGIGVGLLSGYAGGKLDGVVQRVVELVIGVPSLVLAIAVVSVIKDRTTGVVLSAAVVAFPGYVRLSRSVAMEVVAKEYVVAARTLGARTPRVLRRYVLPNALGPLLVQVSLGFGQSLLLISGLGFLGVGISPPQAEWGAMASDALQYLSSDPLLEILPGLAIMLVTLSTTLIADGLREVLDPRAVPRLRRQPVPAASSARAVPAAGLAAGRGNT